MRLPLYNKLSHDCITINQLERAILLPQESTMERYSVITDKTPREILLLRGSGCRWRRCRFCDYHLDFSTDERANFALNSRELQKVTGQYGRLEVINSGSFTDLDAQTLGALEGVCREKGIHTLHVECHWMHRAAIPPFKARFAAQGVTVKVKIGVETFDPLFRESYLDKGIDADARQIAQYCDEVCLLQGLPGQSPASMQADIETGLRWFERVCVNIMQKNTKPIQPDPQVIQAFCRQVLPLYQHDPRVDILLSNTDFGVGGACDAQ